MSCNIHTSPHTSPHISIHTSIHTRIYTTTYVHPRYQVFRLLTAAQRTNGDGELGGGGGGGGGGEEGGGGDAGAKKQVNTRLMDSVERRLSRVATDDKWLLLSLLLRGDIFYFFFLDKWLLLSFFFPRCLRLSLLVRLGSVFFCVCVC